MFKNYFTIAIRNLFRNKAFSLINIFGLAAGLATCLLIMLYIFDETGYDAYHKDADRIYRIAYKVKLAGKEEGWPALAAPVASGLKDNLPEIELATRVLRFPDLDKMLLTWKHGNEAKQFYETNGYYADSTFFQMFNYEFLFGDPLNCLNEPNSLVVSETVARKLFGKENPLNKIVLMGRSFGENPYIVKGVFRESGQKTHIPAHFLLSMRNNDELGNWISSETSWTNNNIFHTYIKLRPGTKRATFEKNLATLFDAKSSSDLKTLGIKREYFLQPVKDIYLHSNLGYEIAPNGNIRYLYILGSIAAFILLIACINFMNLATARSEKRAREVGVRKVMGAGKRALVQQFLGESFMMCTIALGLALFFAAIFLPLFNQLTNKSLSLFSNWQLVQWIVALTAFTGLIAGLYPAFYLSSFRPVAVLKGRILNNFSASAIRKGLVVFQFTISICLILGAIVISGQLNYLNRQQLGFNKSQQIILPLNSVDAQNNFASLKNELLQYPGVKTVTSGSTYPGIQNIQTLLLHAEGKTMNDAIQVLDVGIENDYIETLGITLLEGKLFARNSKADSASIILNEAALKRLGYELKSAVGKKVFSEFGGNSLSLTITGVVKDYNFESLHTAINPLGFVTNQFANKHIYMIADVKTADYSRLLSSFGKSWKKINPGLPFVYSFLDQDFQKNYEKDQRTSGIVLYFTIIAIIIACLGLFGLAAFSAEQRTKEIGIRKVLGASVMNVTTLLSKDFVNLVVIAIVLASPLAWYGMNLWLQNFAYRTPIEWWMFAVAGLSAIIIALLTVSFQAIRSALMNPVKSLRTE